MIDDEKVPEFKLDEFVYGGTTISSRYNKFKEIRAMVKALDAVSNEVWRDSIISIWCDSKAEAIYTVECAGMDAHLGWIANALGNAFYEKVGGHNGLVVRGETAPEEWVAPAWKGDDLYYATQEKDS
ncbi:hypothetical protein [Oleispirillum naphthae]|uniref:hypothetical protein n=1 Tax=Oleispirillum naphthae TaxID=2838853 RepID=UPI003082400D